MADTKNVIKNRSKICTLIALAVIIGSLAFLQLNTAEYSYQISILERSVIYMVVVVSMNLLTGFTGLFPLGQAGFMATGAYVVVISTTPMGSRASVYYVGGILPVIASIQLPISVAPPLGGLAAVAIAALTGIPVLRLKSGYLAIATLGFSEIIRAFIAAPMFDTVTDGSYGLKSIPGFPNIFVAFVLAALCTVLVVLLISSSYGRAFKSIREDEVAAQSMGINLFHYKELSFVISSFFTGMRGGMLTMFMRSIDSKTFQVAFTYDILLIVILGGIDSVTGSVAGAFLVIAGGELLCFFNELLTIAGVSIPLFQSGFRMVIFSILLMAVVLLHRRGIVGNSEFFRDGPFRLIQGIPDRPKGSGERPSSVKKGGIH